MTLLGGSASTKRSRSMRLRFPEEDDARPGAPEGLVDGGGDDVAELEGRRGEPGGHEAGHVGHVGHQERAWRQILNFLLQS